MLTLSKKFTKLDRFCFIQVFFYYRNVFNQFFQLKLINQVLKNTPRKKKIIRQFFSSAYSTFSIRNFLINIALSSKNSRELQSVLLLFFNKKIISQSRIIQTNISTNKKEHCRSAKSYQMKENTHKSS